MGSGEVSGTPQGQRPPALGLWPECPLSVALRNSRWRCDPRAASPAPLQHCWGRQRSGIQVRKRQHSTVNTTGALSFQGGHAPRRGSQIRCGHRVVTRWLPGWEAQEPSRARPPHIGSWCFLLHLQAELALPSHFQGPGFSRGSFDYPLWFPGSSRGPAGQDGYVLCLRGTQKAAI